MPNEKYIGEIIDTYENSKRSYTTQNSSKALANASVSILLYNFSDSGIIEWNVFADIRDTLIVLSHPLSEHHCN